MAHRVAKSIKVKNVEQLHNQVAAIVEKWPTPQPRGSERNLRAVMQRRLNTEWAVSTWNEKDAAATLNVVKQLEENACKRKFPLKHTHSLLPLNKIDEYLYTEGKVPFRKRLMKYFS
eukprot:scpid90274/ scgid27152/ 